MKPSNEETNEPSVDVALLLGCLLLLDFVLFGLIAKGALAFGMLLLILNAPMA